MTDRLCQFVKLVTSCELSTPDPLSEDLTALLWRDLARNLAEFEDRHQPSSGRQAPAGLFLFQGPGRLAGGV